MIKFLDVKNRLQTERYAALCLFGNDSWVKRRALDNVCQAYRVEDDGFGVDRLESPSWEDITLACLTPSMFSPVKLVVCDGFVLPDAPARLADFKKRLADLLRQSDGSFCLVFLADSDKQFAGIDGLETVDCNRLDKSDVVKWIIAFAKRQGVTVDAVCAERIAAYCLADMSRVAVETQKLIDYGNVTLEAIDALVHRDAEYAIYDLSSAVAAKNAAKAMEIYRGLVARGEDPRALFGLIYNFYRRVYYVKTSGFSGEEIASYLGVKPGAVNFARETASRYKPMQLKRALDCLSQADARLKAFVDENEVMNILILQLISL